MNNDNEFLLEYVLTLEYIVRFVMMIQDVTSIELNEDNEDQLIKCVKMKKKIVKDTKKADVLDTRYNEI
jgi:hypothetical protein